MTLQSHVSTSSITVNIMSYRYGHLAAQAIESVLNQTMMPDRINFYDDGVGDCEHLKELYPEVNFTLRSYNLGIIDNFNQALNSVRTDKVMFLGADNWLHPEALEYMNMSEDIVSCDAYIVGEGKYKVWQLPWQPHGSALYNAGIAREVRGYEDSRRDKTEEDSMLFNKMRDAGATFIRVEKPLLYYRRHRMNFNG